jgi:hypothetical protein
MFMDYPNSLQLFTWLVFVLLCVASGGQLLLVVVGGWCV